MPRLEGELVVVPVLSAKAHAKIKKLDFSKALEVKGVYGFVEPQDVPSNKWGPMVHDEAVLAEEPFYAEQFIAGIVAENAESAYKARKLVQVEYEVKIKIFKKNFQMLL